MNYFRRSGYELTEATQDDPASASSEQVDESQRDPLTQLLEQELKARVDAAIFALPALQREAIILREFQELSYEEIATVTGVQVNAVKVRLYRARQTLARQLAPYLSTSGGQQHGLR